MSAPKPKTPEATAREVYRAMGIRDPSWWNGQRRNIRHTDPVVAILRQWRAQIIREEVAR